MTERKMTPKGFLHKTTTKAAASASAFLATYREYLTTGEVAEVTSPIIAKLDAGLILPTPCLQEVKNAVFAHMLELDSRKAEKSLEKAQTAREPKAHVAMVFDETGTIATRINSKGEEEDLIKEFDMPQDAMRWIDRRLVESAPRSYAVMDHTKTDQETIVSRDSAFERVFRGNKGAVCKPQKKSTPRLKFGVKASQDRAHFSHG